MLGVVSLVVEINTTTVFVVKRVLSEATEEESSDFPAITDDRTVRVTYNDSVIVPIGPLCNNTCTNYDDNIYPGERIVNIYGLRSSAPSTSTS